MHSALALCPMHALKEGWLWKQSRRLGTWVRRWYIFKQGILTYVHDPKDFSSECAALGGPLVSAALDREQHWAGSCQLFGLWVSDGSGAARLLAADSGEEAAAWVATLTGGQAALGSRYLVGGGALLGEGVFARVVAATDLTSGSRCAIKVLSPPTLAAYGDLVEKEVRIWCRLGRHPHVAGLREIWAGRAGLAFVSELCAGGQLVEVLADSPGYCEADAARLAGQLLSALVHVHGAGVAHLDIKPENILMKERSLSSPLKLVDFGLSSFFHTPTEPGGTPEFLAPELVTRPQAIKAGGCGAEVDMWAVGVMLAYLLVGTTPFDAPRVEDILAKVSRGAWGFTHPGWGVVSAPAKHLVAALLQVEPGARLSAAAALAHPWVASHRGAPTIPLAHALAAFREERSVKAAEREAAAKACGGDVAAAVAGCVGIGADSAAWPSAAVSYHHQHLQQQHLQQQQQHLQQQQQQAGRSAQVEAALLQSLMATAATTTSAPCSVTPSSHPSSSTPAGPVAAPDGGGANTWSAMCTPSSSSRASAPGVLAAAYQPPTGLPGLPHLSLGGSSLCAAAAGGSSVTPATPASPLTPSSRQRRISVDTRAPGETSVLDRAAAAAAGGAATSPTSSTAAAAVLQGGAAAAVLQGGGSLGEPRARRRITRDKDMLVGVDALAGAAGCSREDTPTSSSSRSSGGSSYRRSNSGSGGGGRLAEALRKPLASLKELGSSLAEVGSAMLDVLGPDDAASVPTMSQAVRQHRATLQRSQSSRKMVTAMEAEATAAATGLLGCTGGSGGGVAAVTAAAAAASSSEAAVPVVSGERARRLSQLQELQTVAAALMARMGAASGGGSSEAGPGYNTMATTSSSSAFTPNAWVASGPPSVNTAAAAGEGGVGWENNAFSRGARASTGSMPAGLASKQQQQYTLTQQQQQQQQQHMQQLLQPQGWMLPAAAASTPGAGWGPAPGALGGWHGGR